MNGEENRSTHQDQYLFHASVIPLALYNLSVQQLNFDLYNNVQVDINVSLVHLEADGAHGFNVTVKKMTQ